MKYFLFRLKKEYFEKLENYDEIDYKYDFELDNSSLLVIFISENLKILGTYKKEGKLLKVIDVNKKELTLKDFYDKLSIISFVNDRTYKLFAKPIKEITEKDYEEIKNGICN